jgi:streptogramin lyase
VHRWTIRLARIGALAVLTVLLCTGEAIATIPPGALTEFPVAAATEPFAITSGPDGNLWFAAAQADQIDRITPAGVVTTFSIPTGQSVPEGITSGPDGDLWFTENSTDKIGSITPAGVITEFPLSPEEGSFPGQITEGSDGNLWFTWGTYIGRLTPGGVISPFFPPNAAGIANGTADDITAGPDGNLWVSYTTTMETTSGYILRITPSGAITAFATTPYSPSSITVGPQGNLWFTATSETANEIGEMTTAGAIVNAFTAPEGVDPRALTEGADGNLWFTDSDGAIGEMSPAGAFQTIALASPRSLPESITAGPDQNIWFTEAGANKIGRIILAPRSLSPPVITGVPAQGQTLSASNGSWSNQPTAFAYQWEQCDQSGNACTAIAGATASSYAVTASLVGDTLRVVVTASNAGGASAPAASAASGIVAPQAVQLTPTATAVACVPTTTAVGHATTCTAAVTDVSGAVPPTGVVSFATVGIAGAFGPASTCALGGAGGSASCSVTFTPTALGSGSTTITAAYTGDGAHAGSVGSTALSVIGVQGTSTSAVCSPGTITVGQATTCTATVTGASGVGPPTGSVAFATVSPGTYAAGSDCTLQNALVAATCSVTFTPTADRSTTITFAVTYSGDPTHSVSSAPTAVAFPPVAGVTANATVLEGEVVITPPSSSAGHGASVAHATGTFAPLKGETVAIPVGSTIDTRKGTVRIATAADNRQANDPRHRLQDGTFSAGIFILKQLTLRQQMAVAHREHRRRVTGVPATSLVLSNTPGAPSAAHCRRTGPPGKGVVRSFHGVAKGLYETVGAASTTTVRNAEWNVEDRCDGTLTEVGTGEATVAYVSHHRTRTVTVHHGQAYFVAERFLAEKVAKGIGG